MKRIEKFEVAKNSGNYYYTGNLEDLENGWVVIRTTRGEVLRFRKEQIQGRQELKGDEGSVQNIKDIKI